MASEPGAVSDDPDALKHTTVAVLGAHNNNDDNDEPISALTEPSASATVSVASAASTTAPKTKAMDNENREETRAATVAEIQDNEVIAAEQNPSSAKSGGDVSRDYRDTSLASTTDPDKAIAFPFLNTSSNQLNELLSASHTASVEHSGASSFGPPGSLSEPQQRTRATSEYYEVVSPGQSFDSSLLHDKDYANPQELADALPVEQYSGSSTEYASMDALPSTATGSSKRPAPLPLSPTQPFSWNDILRVQNMIERCLQQYLSKTEILQTLQDQAQVDPEFTNVVWLKLQEQNPSFFRAYSILLQLKEQIVAFNYLVAQQRDVMQSDSARMSLLAGPSLPPLLQVGTQGYDRDAIDTSDKLSSRATSQHPVSTTSLPQQTQSQSMPFESLDSSNSNSDTAPTSSDHFLPSPLPLPSPIKTDLDTHAFFT